MTISTHKFQSMAIKGMRSN